MREIKLVNNEGEEFDLTRPDACLQDISGIGMEIEFETVRIGQCDVVVDEQPQYNPVSGMIPFMDMEPYTDFLQFIAKRPITLAYKPKNAWYFTSVRVSVVEKEEITPVDEYAETDVDFYRLGPWYSTLRIDPYSDTTAAKRYTYTYPYRYVDSTAPGILLQNPSGQESPCTIEIYGPARNPRWELVKNGPEPQSVFLGDTPQGGTVDAPVELTGISSTVINKNLVTLPVPRPLRRVGAAQDKCSARVTSVYDKRIVLDGSEDWRKRTDISITGGSCFYPNNFVNDAISNAPVVASAYFVGRVSPTINLWDMRQVGTNVGIQFNAPFAEVSDFTAWLAEHPLTVYYQSTAYNGTNGLDICLTEYQNGFVELDGTENWRLESETNCFLLDRGLLNGKFDHNEATVICDRYKSGTYINRTTPCVYAYNYGGTSLGFADNQYDSVDSWKSYLAAQKAAGTPVQVAYQLAAPEVYATDPVDIQKAAGLSISSGAVTTEIKEGQKLVVRSEADRLEIAIYTTENEWVEDVYQQSDFSTARFIYAPAGDSTLKFSHEGSQELNVSVEVRAYYEAV